MIIAPYLVGVMATLSGEAIFMLIIGAISHLIGKYNEGKAATEAIKALVNQGDENERNSE